MKSPIAGIPLEKNELNRIEYYIARGSEGIWFPRSMLEDLRESDSGTKTQIIDQIQSLCSLPEYTGVAYISPESENTRMRFARVKACPELKVHVCPQSGGHWVFNQARENLEGIFAQTENGAQKSPTGSITIAPNPLDPQHFEDTRGVGERFKNAFAEGFLGKGRMDRMTLFKVHVCLILLVPLFIIFVSSKIATGYPTSPRAFAFTLWVTNAVYLPIAILLKFSACARRFHDMGKSAFHCLGLLLPFYNLYLYALLFFSVGEMGPNKYGED